MIKIRNVNKFYGKTKSLSDITLDIVQGEVFGLLGPNGAGKSTLLSILATIVTPSSGTVRIADLDMKKQGRQIRKQIGYVPQEIALWEDLTVRENMLFWSRFVKKKADKDQLMELCETVQLQNKWQHKVSELSGGMKRKLNIAIALIHDPAILLMDEPTVGIDLESKVEINGYIKKLAQKGKTIVYTTHDISEIIRLCDRIGVLKQGALEFNGTLEQAAQFVTKNAKSVFDPEELVYQLLKNK